MRLLVMKNFFNEYVSFLKNLNYSNKIDFMKEENTKRVNLRYFQFIHLVNSLNINKQYEGINELKEKSLIIKAFLFPNEFDFNQFDLDWLTLRDVKLLYKEIRGNKMLKDKIAKSLKYNYNENLAKIFLKYFA